MMPERAFTSAPASASIETISPWPCAAAHMIGVWPRQLSIAFRDAPWATSTFAAATWPARAQVWSAVSPSGPVRFALTPALSRRSTIAGSPSSHASGSGVTP